MRTTSVPLPLGGIPSGVRCFEDAELARCSTSPSELKAKWRNEQIANQRHLLVNISGTWRRKQVEDCQKFSNRVAPELHNSAKNFEDSFDTTVQNDLSIPCISGWVHTRRRFKILGMCGFHSWDAGWFVAVLEHGSLVLNQYDNETYSAPVRVVPLSPAQCAIRESGSDGGGRFFFSLSIVGTHQRMLLGASTREQAERWTAVLNSVAEELRSRTSMLPSPVKNDAS
jgi:hypothetical protein